MLLNNLSLSENSSTEEVKAALEQKLGNFLPVGSYNVILRNYQGDFRVRSNNESRYQAMFLLDAAARKAAIEHKEEMQAEGFQVSPSGDISVN